MNVVSIQTGSSSDRSQPIKPLKMSIKKGYTIYENVYIVFTFHLIIGMS